MTVTCATCEDTHRMTLRDRAVMCTRCPTPCDDCASSDGRGAYCAVTPCSCSCHGVRSADRSADPLAEVERLSAVCRGYVDRHGRMPDATGKDLLAAVEALVEHLQRFAQ